MTRDTVGRPMEILLVEDDLEDAGMTIDALRQGDVPCRISLVRDGEEAMDFLLRRDKFRRAPQPDMILLDLNLPKKSGREVLAEVKADRRLARVPVVVLTGSTVQQQILQSGYRNVQFGSLTSDLRREGWFAGTATARRNDNGRSYDFDIGCSVNQDTGDIRSVQANRR